MQAVFQIHKLDNVGVVIVPRMQAGSCFSIGGASYTALCDVPFGHKVALRDIPAGSPVIKYGHRIGFASQPIQKGEWVHSHNLKTALSGTEDYIYTPDTDCVCAECTDTFLGYARQDGSVGIRNELWVLPMVSCVNHTAQMIVDAFREKHGEAMDIFAMQQPFGCSQLGEDHEATVRILRDLATHPNVGGVILLSLGCENNVMDTFLEGLPAHAPERVLPLVCQKSEDEIADGVALLEQLRAVTAADVRTQQPLSKLRVGFKCGASDAFSGITANPLAGKLCEMLVRHGAAAAMTEVPEMFGAETQLMNRAADEQVFRDVVFLINDFKQYYISHGQPVYENPSPGNKEGGITTLEEKSLGCIQKGGRCRVDGVVSYGGKLRSAGLNLICGPGNDPIAITTMAAAGCQLMIFTTGRGNPLGSVVPTIKLASNAPLAARKNAWIDFSAAEVLQTRDFSALSEALYRLVLQTANGEYRTKSEIAGYKEIGIFKNGVTL